MDGVRGVDVRRVLSGAFTVVDAGPNTPEGVAALRRRIEAETDAVRAIYRRVVEEPARAAGWQPRHEDRRGDDRGSER